jgi:DNA-binding HxlR family transcriptional regulator
VGGLTREARLEQLETLLDAGLLDREEYRERKRRIEEEMG